MAGFGSGSMPALLNFLTRFRPRPDGGAPDPVPVPDAPPAGIPRLATDRYHLASRTGNRHDADPFTRRPAALYGGGQPTTKPTALMGGVLAINIHPNPKRAALGSSNPSQEFGGATVYDGKLPPQQFWRALPYARVPPKLPGLSTAPSAMAASGFVDPHAIAARQAKGPVGRGLRWTP